jgi:hypothetical protein
MARDGPLWPTPAAYADLEWAEPPQVFIAGRPLSGGTTVGRDFRR